MPWKEPGNSSNNKDPWTGRPKQTPPDLEAFLRELRKKITALFKLKSLNKNSASITKTLLPIQLNTKTVGLVFSFLLLAWLSSGFFTVDTSEQAVITRFGKYSATLPAGHHWIFRPIETRYIISENNIPYSSQINLITRDENKVSVVTTLHYTVVNARQFLFSTQPLQSLREAIASAVNQTLSQLSLEQLLNVNFSSSQQILQTKINKLLANYATGLAISDIELQPIQVPEELKASFEDVTRAEAEKKQLENQADVYAMQIEPKTKSQAKLLIADAKSYQQQVILNAKAETARFLALLPTYEASPELTRKRLYLEAMQAMMTHSNKMLVDNSANTSLYLNIDKPAIQNPEKITNQSSIKTSPTETNSPSPGITTSAKTDNKVSSSYGISGGYE
ncbi:MAG: FtsH protease activity modulator HflK [Pseudomonadota bacterium]